MRTKGVERLGPNVILSQMGGQDGVRIKLGTLLLIAREAEPPEILLTVLPTKEDRAGVINGEALSGTALKARRLGLIRNLMHPLTSSISVLSHKAVVVALHHGHRPVVEFERNCRRLEIPNGYGNLTKSVDLGGPNVVHLVDWSKPRKQTQYDLLMLFVFAHKRRPKGRLCGVLSRDGQAT